MGDRFGKGCGALALLGAVVIAVALLWPMGGHSKEANKRSYALSNLKQAGLAMRLYTEDSGDRFPVIDRWSDLVEPYCADPKVIGHVVLAKTELSPAMNALLDGQRVTDKEDLVLFIHVPGRVRNAWGGPSSCWEGYGEKKWVQIGFVGGYARARPRAELETLTWRP